MHHVPEIDEYAGWPVRVVLAAVFHGMVGRNPAAMPKAPALLQTTAACHDSAAEMKTIANEMTKAGPQKQMRRRLLSGMRCGLGSSGLQQVGFRSHTTRQLPKHSKCSSTLVSIGESYVWLTAA